MTVHQPTLKQLQYLVALRQQGHFGKAADACFVTQSTLSAGLRELEALLGVTLVERTRRVVRFTALGERIADQAPRRPRGGGGPRGSSGLAGSSEARRSPSGSPTRRGACCARQRSSPKWRAPKGSRSTAS